MRKITSEPVLTVFDAIALSDTQTAAYEILASGGTLVLTLSPTIPEDKRVADKTIIDVTGSGHIKENHDVAVGFYNSLTELLKSKELKVCFIRTIGCRDFLMMCHDSQILLRFSQEALQVSHQDLRGSRMVKSAPRSLLFVLLRLPSLFDRLTERSALMCTFSLNYHHTYSCVYPDKVNMRRLKGSNSFVQHCSRMRYRNRPKPIGARLDL